MNDDKFHSELLVLLKNAYDDIERAKQQGWRDFYYVLFAVGVVTGLYRAVYGILTFQGMHHLFFSTPPALMILGIWLVWATQRTLTQRRKLVEHGYSTHLDKNIQEILNGPLAESVNRGLYPRLYTAVIALTAAFGMAIMIGLYLAPHSPPC
jgi:hypothetical protein